MQLQPGVKACQSCGHQVVAFVVPAKKTSGCAIAAFIILGLIIGFFVFMFSVVAYLRHRSAEIEAKAPPSARWKHSETISKMDGSKTAYWYREAEGEVTGWLSSTTPLLYVECGKKIDVYFNAEMQSSVENGDKIHTVRIRYDDAAPVKQYWRDSLDGRALFAPNGLPIAKKLLTSNSFAFEFTPFNASNIQVATFDVRGLKEAIGDEKACAAITGTK
jgi:hypothetical protein